MLYGKSFLSEVRVIGITSSPHQSSYLIINVRPMSVLVVHLERDAFSATWNRGLGVSGPQGVIVLVLILLSRIERTVEHCMWQVKE